MKKPNHQRSDRLTKKRTRRAVKRRAYLRSVYDRANRVFLLKMRRGVRIGRAGRVFQFSMGRRP